MYTYLIYIIINHYIEISFPFRNKIGVTNCSSIHFSLLLILHLTIMNNSVLNHWKNSQSD